jgi:mannose-6-phosphate isomerase-like protein (cupin superfamily)
MQRTLTKPAERRRRGRRPHPTRGGQKVVRCDERTSNPKDPKPPDRRGPLALRDRHAARRRAPLQIQHCEDEYFYVLEEDYEFLLEGRTLRADAGCLLYVPKGILHAHKNVGNGEG